MNIALVGASGYVGMRVLAELLRRGHPMTAVVRNPAKLAPAARLTVIAVLRREPGLNWTFLSPSALLQPGERTGNFRLGTDRLLTDSNGESTISLEDLAVALVDELESPRHARMRFTAGY